ncbi:MAG: type VII secretion protein EccB [Mycolicibacterium sp.]|uniref:type VII secretion protein EccB n=1 Tax=Mycolicibacterium sp. TaxID=2320850 RepID=UPI003D1485D4
MTWSQVTASFWLRARTGYALTLRNVSMHFDLSRWLRMMPMVAGLMVVLICAGAFVFSMIRPAGVVGESRVVMARESGQIYVNANGRLYPALNLASARLISGSYETPEGVTQASIMGYPIGAKVGIAGAPDDTPVTNGDATSVAVCQRADADSVSGRVSVTVLDGGIKPGNRAGELSSGEALLGTLNGRTYLVWNGMKSLVDPSDRIVLGALGIDPDTAAHPAPLGGEVGNAIPSNLPLVEPVVPGAGDPVPWKLGVPAGGVVRSEVPGRGTQLYVVLAAGVQKVSPTVAAMIRSENAFGQPSAPLVSPDALADVPEVTVVQVGQYPPDPVRIVPVSERPVTCWWWQRGRTSASATARVLAGTELPIAASADAAVVPVVSTHTGVDGADAVYMAADAANWVAATGNADGSSTREALWWISRSGTRFGVPGGGSQSRSSLGLTMEPLLMPWSVLRLFPSGLPEGVALTRSDAMTQHDNLPSDPSPGPLAPAGS